MRALPLWQPWADLVVDGAKRVETRPRPLRTLVGERVAIHAALTRDHLWRCVTPPFDAHLRDVDMWFGALVGAVTVISAFQMTTEYVRTMWEREPTEYAFGDYAPGRWAFQLRDPERFSAPVPWRGSQGVFFVPDDVAGYVHVQAQGTLL